MNKTQYTLISIVVFTFLGGNGVMVHNLSVIAYRWALKKNRMVFVNQNILGVGVYWSIAGTRSQARLKNGSFIEFVNLTIFGRRRVRYYDIFSTLKKAVAFLNNIKNIFKKVRYSTHIGQAELGAAARAYY